MNKIFTQVEEKLSVIIYVVMLAITFANVIGRYCFHASISATDEITTNIFVLLSVIGTGVAAKSRSHLGLSVLTELMPPKVQHIISGFANLLGTAFGAVLLYTGYNIHFQSGCGEVAPCERSEGVCPAEIAGRKRDIAAGE